MQVLRSLDIKLHLGFRFYFSKNVKFVSISITHLKRPKETEQY